MRKTVLAIIVLACACAPTSRVPDVDQASVGRESDIQAEIALRQHRDHWQRFVRVVSRVTTTNVEFCKDMVAYVHGFTAMPAEKFADPGFRRVAHRVFGSIKDLGYIAVVVDPPASEAGLRVGDNIVAVDGIAIPPADGNLSPLNERLSAARKFGKSLAISVRRGQDSKAIVVHPVLQCDPVVGVSKTAAANAFAAGQKVTVTTGMLDFLKTDDELALVVGHELAHIIRDHIAVKTGNRMVGMLVGLIVTVATGVDATGLGAELGGLMFSQDFEAEADYVGAYLAARAGYDIEKAADLWRRMAALHPQAIHAAALATHPGTANRFLVLERAAKEIAAKKAARLPLIPVLKDQTDSHR
jgi:hypothetical protein